jgi:hypothetical protein
MTRITTGFQNLGKPLRFHFPVSIVRSFLVAQVAGAVFLLSCGVQGPPQPPRVEVPGRIADLSVHQVGQRLEIGFTLPQQAQDGERLTKPLEIELLRAQLTPGANLPKSPPLALWISLEPNEWARYANQRRITYPAALSEVEFKNWRGQDVIIAVRTLTRGIRHRPMESEVSNLARLRVLDVSRPVEHLESETTENAIALRWQPPAKTLDGLEVKFLDGYRVYRSATGNPGSFQLLGENNEPSYLDSDFEFGHSYSYEVGAVFKDGGATAESEPSQPYQVIPRDVFPPARPTGLTGLYTNGAVELVWDANTGKDLAGYSVYRRENGEQPKRLNKALLPTPILRDTSVQPSHTYFYQVSAVDLSNNESAPCPEVEVETGH